MKILISLLLFTITHLFAADITLVPYLVKSSYDGVSKDSSMIGGVYSKYKTADYTVELSYENMKLDYNSTSTLKTIKQDDFTVAYSQLLSSTKKIKGTVHYILSNNTQSDKAKVYYMDFQHFKKNRFNVGLEIAYSRYDTSAIADDIRQARLYYGSSFGDYKSTMGKFIATIGVTLISPKYTDSNSSLESSYSSYDLSLTQYKGKFINKLSWWAGDQLYAVKDSAFTVYNLNELHDTGLSLSTRYSLNSNSGVSLSYLRDSFLDLDVNKKDTMERIMLSFDYTIR